MIAALLLQLVIATAPAHNACAAGTQCAPATHAAQPVKPKTEDCNGVHCGPLGEKAPASDTRYGGENLNNAHVASGYDSRAARYGSSRSDRNFDNAHVTSGYDRTGYDTSGTWPAH